MTDQEYTLINTLDLLPTYISLGFKPSAFVGLATLPNLRSFSASLNGKNNDLLYLFKGSDYYIYNLRTNMFEGDPAPIRTNWAYGSLPQTFATAIDAAAWAGPTAPFLWYFFKEGQYVTMQAAHAYASWGVAGGVSTYSESEASPSDWKVIEGPRSIEGTGWAGFGSGSVYLHGLGDKSGRLHIFKAPFYRLHNLLDGSCEWDGEIADYWPGHPFADKIDLAFYGTGPEEEQIFFFSGVQYAQYDVSSKTFIKIDSIDRKFPALAVHMRIPQLFLVEDYALEIYAGPPVKGTLTKTIPVQANTRTEVVIITEVQTSYSTKLHQNMLEQQTDQTTSEFNSQINNRSDTSESSDSYRYRMDAVFHGEANANSLWGGEVNASLGVAGGTDSKRNSFADSAFRAISNQATASTQGVTQRVVESDVATQVNSYRYESSKQVVDNLNKPASEARFFSLIQPFVALLVLKNVRAAFTDGIDPPNIFSIKELFDNVWTYLGVTPTAVNLLTYVKTELSAIEDFSGTSRSFIADVPSGLIQINNQMSSKYTLRETEPDQIIETTGLIKSAKVWRLPTYQMTIETKVVQ